MKIILEPTVTILSTPNFFPHPRYVVPEDGSPAERLIAHAGKGCYDSYGADGRSVSDHIASLVGSGHGSVLEHANVSFFIEGVSRGLSHELVRHRHLSFSQRSTRYTAEEDAGIVLEPFLASIYEKMERDSATLDEAAIVNLFIKGCTDDLIIYSRLVTWLMELNTFKLKGKDLRKWARGIARQKLPHALETRLTVTGNLRAWRDFIEQRLTRHAEAEIYRLASAIAIQLKETIPFVFNDFRWDTEAESLKPLMRKV